MADALIPLESDQVNRAQWVQLGGDVIGPLAEQIATLLTECQLGDVHPSIPLYLAGNTINYIQKNQNSVHERYARGQAFYFPRLDSIGNYGTAKITSVAKDQSWANVDRVIGGRHKSGRMQLPLPHTWVRDLDLEK